jgi:hypothetical protein
MDNEGFQKLYHGTWAITCGLCEGFSNVYGKFINRETKDIFYLCSECAKHAKKIGLRRIKDGN